MQQRGQPEHEVGFQPVPGLQGDGPLQHGQRVLVDVLVPEMLVGLKPEPGNLREHLIGYPGVHQQRDPAHRAAARCQQELDELIPDPFRRHHRQPAGHRGHRRLYVGLHGKAELCGEPRGAEHPERVVVERVFGLPRRAQHPGPQVAHPPEQIDQLQ